MFELLSSAIFTPNQVAQAVRIELKSRLNFHHYCNFKLAHLDEYNKQEKGEPKIKNQIAMMMKSSLFLSLMMMKLSPNF